MTIYGFFLIFWKNGEGNAASSPFPLITFPNLNFWLEKATWGQFSTSSNIYNSCKGLFSKAGYGIYPDLRLFGISVKSRRYQNIYISRDRGQLLMNGQRWKFFFTILAKDYLKSWLRIKRRNISDDRGEQLVDWQIWKFSVFLQ